MNIHHLSSFLCQELPEGRSDGQTWRFILLRHRAIAVLERSENMADGWQEPGV